MVEAGASKRMSTNMTSERVDRSEGKEEKTSGNDDNVDEGKEWTKNAEGWEVGAMMGTSTK